MELPLVPTQVQSRTIIRNLSSKSIQSSILEWSKIAYLLCKWFEVEVGGKVIFKKSKSHKSKLYLDSFSQPEHTYLYSGALQ